MSTLVSNGSKLYRKSNSLVRTPITVAVAPDSMAVYEVAEDYHLDGSVWYPVGGFHGQQTVASTYEVGYNCNTAYLAASDWRQVWRTITNGHQPETCFYQGAYATSGATEAQCTSFSESYWRLGAYHFSVPQSLRSLTITSAKVTFNLGGTVVSRGPAAVGSRYNTKGWGVQDPWYVTFCAVASLGSPSQIFTAQPNGDDIDIEALTLATSSSCAPTGFRDMFEFAGTSWTRNYPDGAIPILTGNPTSTFNVGSGNLSAINTNISNGFWFVPLTNVGVWSATNYLPVYMPPDNYMWGCMALWGLSLELTVD